MKRTNSSLIQAIAAGDRRAFDELYNSLFVYLSKIAFSFLNDFDAAEETVQDSFLRLWINRKSLDQNRALKPYLAQTVRNACINQLDHEKVKLKYATHAQHIGSNTSPDASDWLIGKELNDKINEVIDALPTQCRKVFEMSRHEGLKYREIAEKLSISEKTVEQQVSKALKRLKEGLVHYIPALIILSYFTEVFMFDLMIQ